MQVGVVLLRSNSTTKLVQSQSPLLSSRQQHLWLNDYLHQNPAQYNMNDGVEGLSSSFPFRDPPYGGPLNLLKMTGLKRVAGRRKGAKHQKLCGIGSGCEYFNDNNIQVAENLDKDKVLEGLPDKPSDDILNEVKAAMDEYQKDMDIEKKLWKGSPSNAFKGRFQSLCGIGAGCEDAMNGELEDAAAVDSKTVYVNMPSYPGADTIDEVYEAISDKKHLEEKEDERRRGVSSSR